MIAGSLFEIIANVEKALLHDPVATAHDIYCAGVQRQGAVLAVNLVTRCYLEEQVDEPPPDVTAFLQDLSELLENQYNRPVQIAYHFRRVYAYGPRCKEKDSSD